MAPSAVVGVERDCDEFLVTLMPHQFRLLILSRYGTLGASSRLRTQQYVPYLRAAGFNVETSILFSDTMLERRYCMGRYRSLDLLGAYWRRICVMLFAKNYDIVLIEKEALPWLPACVEQFLLRHSRVALDFDDAQFHRYDDHYSWVIRALFSKKIDRLIRQARVIISGNKYIAQHCMATGARWVEIIPTVIDLDRYTAKRTHSAPEVPVIVWIGTPWTVKLLAARRGALAELAKRHAFKLRVIGSGQITMPGVPLEVLPWCAGTESAMISHCDIGIMPLSDAPWERGKCAYKLIQYMASGLPVVASPVGANCDVVIDGENGFFATSDAEWVDQLARLLSDAELRQRFGQAGRLRVERYYCLQKTASMLANIMTKCASEPARVIKK